MTSENTKNKSLLRRKKLAIAAISVLSLIAIIAVIITSILIKEKKIMLEGETYIVKPEKGEYALFSESGELLDKTSDGYFVLTSGNLASVDKKTGDTKVEVKIDLSGTEQASSNGTVLIFEYLSSKDIKSISVSNEHGEYSFSGEKNSAGNVVFTIDGYEETLYSGENFSMLIACAGYTVATRIDKEISLDRFGYEEYGLEKERVSYTIETFDGESYTVWIGDKTPDGNGYYVRLKTDDRYALYILTATSYIEETLLAPIENMVKTVFNISYMGQSMSTAYIDVQNCKLTHYTYSGESASGEVYAHFSYLSKMPDGSNRLDGEYKSQPFIGLDSMAVYIPSTNSINEMLYNLNTMTPLSTKNLGTSNVALREYGLDKPAIVLEFEHTSTASDGTATHDRQLLYFSKMTENGTYYAYSEIERNGKWLESYNQIVELDGGMLDFLSYSKSRWVEPNYFSLYSPYCESIEITRGEDRYFITLDHESGDEDIVQIDYNGKKIAFENEDESYYDKNGIIQTASHSKSLFNKYYVMLGTSALIAEHRLTGSEKESVMTADNLILTIKVTTTSGREMTYEYFRASDLRSIIKLSVKNAPATVGNPESSDFYVVTDRADKIWEDTCKIFEGAVLFKNGEFEEYSKIEISST